MKKLIMATVIAACIALCAAVWPQRKAIEETPAPSPTSAVCAPEAAIAECNTEVETAPSAEKEKEVAPPTEAPSEILPAPSKTPAAPEAQPTPELKTTSEVAPEPTPEPTPEPYAAQAAIEPQPSDMVYVEGFGWIESQGPNRVEYAADMYENDNKIGIMG